MRKGEKALLLFWIFYIPAVVWFALWIAGVL